VALLGNLTGSSQFFNDPDFYNEIATQSLRFDDGSSAYLSRTFSGNVDNDKKMTISVWVKRGIISNATQVIIGNYDTTRFLGELSWRSDDKIVFRPGGLGDGSSNSYSVQTTAQFRDVSSWYHIVLAYDTTQSTDTNRVKMYVNGTQRTLEALSGSHSFAPQNYAHDFSYAGANNAIGYYPGGFNSNYLDGYLSEFNFIDGLTLDPTYFGETKNGVWIAKEYTGSYGTNGYRLEFKNTSVGSGSSSTIGADTSGNDNHWTSNNIVASDCAIPDSPENNFTTLNSIYGNLSVTLSEGNLKYTTGTSVNPVTGTISIPTTGKWYWEVYVSAVGDAMIGVQNRPDQQANGYSGRKTVYYREGGSGGGSGSIYIEGSGNGGDQASYTNGDVVSVLYNADDMKIAWYKNGSQEGLTFDVTDTDVMPIVYQASGSGSTSGTFNFGQDSTFAGTISAGGNTDANGIGDFKYTVPSGYLALCSSNLPEPTIGPNSLTQADDHFNTVFYTGNATDDTAIAVDFQPDWTWIKKRSGAQEHVLFDSSRGATKRLFSNLTNAESDEATSLKAFTSSGFTLGTHSSVNDNTETFVAWNWKANGGTTTTNDASATSVGTIDSVYQANTTAGFSIVQYETNSGTSGSSQTVAHGLSQAPTFMILKSRDQAGTSWMVYYGDNTDYLRLDSSGATIDGQSTWNDTSPTSTVFSIGTNGGDTNNTNGGSMIGYIFHDVEGYSKFGSYTANENTNGVFIYLGFRPAWAMIKRTAGNGWAIQDSARSTFNPVNNLLQANESNAEYTTDVKMDFLSNGIKMRNDSGFFNYTAGNSFIYMAFAEAPFKYANAR
jgi:hypothetical protein